MCEYAHKSACTAVEPQTRDAPVPRAAGGLGTLMILSLSA